MPDEPCPSFPKIPGQTIGMLIGLVFILGSFCMFALVLTGFTKIEWKDIALVIVGALLNQCSTIIAKWYGASQSSERKTEAIVDAAKAAAVTATDTAKVLAAEVKDDGKA